MRIIFMGSGNFAVPALGALIDSQHTVLELVCQPDKPAGRGLKLTACPTACAARDAGLSVYQPDSLKPDAAYDHFRDLAPDLIVVVAYGKLLPPRILALPRYGCVNVHASLLPKYRGAAPINWAIVNGETFTGVTTMFMDERMDEGDVLLWAETTIDELDDAVELELRLAAMGAELLIKTIADIEDGTIERQPQDHGKASYAPLLTKHDGLIDWTKTARQIANIVRGLVPWPVAHTHLDGKLVRIFEAHAGDEPCTAPPGTVIRCAKHLAIATGKGVIYPLEVQLEGKKRMRCEDMLRGCKISEGMKLG